MSAPCFVGGGCIIDLVRSDKRLNVRASLPVLYCSFLSQKPHLSSSDVARIRDATGMWGMAGV